MMKSIVVSLTLLGLSAFSLAAQAMQPNIIKLPMSWPNHDMKPSEPSTSCKFSDENIAAGYFYIEYQGAFYAASHNGQMFMDSPPSWMTKGQIANDKITYPDFMAMRPDADFYEICGSPQSEPVEELQSYVLKPSSLTKVDKGVWYSFDASELLEWSGDASLKKPTLIWEAQDLPSGLSINSESGAISGVYTGDSTRAVNITLSASYEDSNKVIQQQTASYLLEFEKVALLVKHISSGTYHRCLTTLAGEAKCWGSSGGQLGTGNAFADLKYPGQVVGLTANVIKTEAGFSKSCALVGDGVRCWGTGAGDGYSLENSYSTPVIPVGLSSGVSDIAVGSTHSCALLNNGSVKCWGKNGAGELGDGTTSDRTSPVSVVGLPSDIKAISAGGSNTCALTLSGEVYCWGYLQTASHPSSLTPVKIISSAARQISVGNVGCALMNDGTVTCWGSNAEGKMGKGFYSEWDDVGMTHAFNPGSVNALNQVVSIASGQSAVCALKSNGSVMCWGYQDPMTYEYVTTPTVISGFASGIKDMDVDEVLCAIDVNNHASCTNRILENKQTLYAD